MMSRVRIPISCTRWRSSATITRVNPTSCMSRGITIVKGSVGKDPIHLLLSCPPTMAQSEGVQYLKGRSSRMLQDEFSHLKKK
ncbi:hypothetical protein G9U52_35300 [Paenibacillus sp. S3N08]|uniref:Transposase IS200-like domain-containing protein n=1 Tax=Paenibacillus agricola TaxID=2716264 RepID=A0ABX0JHU9_9BACL|nr:hypothetical protein [Paenibacillus agricola]